MQNIFLNALLILVKRTRGWQSACVSHKYTRHGELGWCPFRRGGTALLCELGGATCAHWASISSTEKKTKPPRERSVPSLSTSGSVRFVFSTHLLHKFLLLGELGRNVTYSKLAGFTLMSFYCLPGRFGDEKDRKRNEIEKRPRRFTRSTSTPKASVSWKPLQG